MTLTFDWLLSLCFQCGERTACGAGPSCRTIDASLRFRCYGFQWFFLSSESVLISVLCMCVRGCMRVTGFRTDPCLWACEARTSATPAAHADTQSGEREGGKRLQGIRSLDVEFRFRLYLGHWNRPAVACVRFPSFLNNTCKFMPPAFPNPTEAQ